MFTAAEINAAIAAGRTVTARQADLPRRGQPNRGASVTLTHAFDGQRYGDVRATAEGYRGRFGVTDVLIDNDRPDSSPDHY